MNLTIAATLALFMAAGGPGAEVESLETRLDAALQRMNDGQDSAGKSDLQVLETEIRDVLAGSPSADLYALLGRVQFYLENDSAAAESFERSLALDPDQVAAHQFQGLMQMFSGRFDAAEASLRKAIALEPKDPNLHFALGDALLHGGKADAARKAFEDAVRLDPHDARSHHRLAQLLVDQDDFQGAVGHYEALVEISKEQPDVYYNLGQTYQNLGRHEKACEAFERVVALDPSDWGARAKVIQELQALGLSEERDAARAELIRMRRNGDNQDLNSAELYCRDQFRTAEKMVFAFEYFELAGAEPRLYEFRVLDAGSNEEELTVSLGSYELTTKIMQETGKLPQGARAYHLDAYSPDGLEHWTYAFFAEEPSYDKTRTLVEGVIDGSLQPMSGTRRSEETGESEPEG